MLLEVLSIWDHVYSGIVASHTVASYTGFCLTSQFFQSFGQYPKVVLGIVVEVSSTEQISSCH